MLNAKFKKLTKTKKLKKASKMLQVQYFFAAPFPYPDFYFILKGESKCFFSALKWRHAIVKII